MKHITRLGCLISSSLLLLSSCVEPEITSEEHALKVIAQHPADSFEYFVTQAGYPASPRIYFNEALLRQVSSQSTIYICLSQQRARMYVKGKVAADWPVSTGISSRPTPTGSYRILEKKEDHASTLWGRLYDADGKLLNRDADSRVVTVPEGGKFVGSAMPYWQRLTWDGIGMHIGRVVPGRKLSHGCIRMPRQAAARMFRLTTLGRTRVHVINEVESKFPKNARTAMHAQRIVANYRKYVADYANQHGADEDVEMTEVFLQSQEDLTYQLPSKHSVEHIELHEDALENPNIHPAAPAKISSSDEDDDAEAPVAASMPESTSGRMLSASQRRSGSARIIRL